MATGVQTSLNRSKRSGLGSRTQPKSKVQEILELWGGQTKRMKILAVGSLVFFVAAVFSVMGYQSQQANVDLYQNKLNAQDVWEVSNLLSEHNIEHRVSNTNDGIQMHPGLVRSSRALLASRGIPRNRTEAPVQSGLGPTSEEKRKQLEFRLENELVSTLREVEGIDDARVKLAIAERSYYTDSTNVTKASVFLRQRAGHNLGLEEVNGVAALVSYAVPGLAIENVKVLDKAGHDLSLAPVDVTPELQVQSEEEARLAQKLQVALEKIYPDRVHAAVNLTLDFSQVERHQYTPGGSQDDGLVKESMMLVSEIFEGPKKEMTQVSSGNSDRSYSNQKESVNFKFRENYFKMLRTAHKTESVTATVLINGAPESETQQVEKMVAGILGLDPSRGDFAVVNGLPWDQVENKVWSEQQGVAIGHEGSSKSSQSISLTNLLWLGLGFGGVLGTLAIMLKWQGLSVVRATQEPESAHPLTSTILDHNHSKDGTRSAPAMTITNTSKGLESLMRENPALVRNALKETWLSEN